MFNFPKHFYAEYCCLFHDEFFKALLCSLAQSDEVKAKEEIITRVTATRAKVEKNRMYEKNTHTHTHTPVENSREIARSYRTKRKRDGRKEEGERKGEYIYGLAYLP